MYIAVFYDERMGVNGMGMKIEHGVDSWRFWLLWVFSSGISFAFGTGVVTAALQIVSNLENYQNIFYLAVVVLGIVLLGFLPGAAQGLVLKRYFARTAEWILATTGGFALALLPAYLSYKLFIFVIEPIESLLTFWIVLMVLMVLNGFFYGALTGTFQWLVLKAKVTGAAKWILANAVGWGVGMGIGSMIATILSTLLLILFIGMEIVLHGWSDEAEPLLTLAFIIVGVAMGMFSAMITGSVMVRLLRGSDLMELEAKSDPVPNS